MMSKNIELIKALGSIKAVLEAGQYSDEQKMEIIADCVIEFRDKMQHQGYWNGPKGSLAGLRVER
jgi:hypothetical protein